MGQTGISHEVAMSIPRNFSKQERLSKSSHDELVALLIAGQVPIAVMALTVAAVASLAYLTRADSWTLILAAAILTLLMARSLLVAAFAKRQSNESASSIDMRQWEMRYAKVVLPYATLLGLFNFHVATTGSQAIQLLVVAETFGFCAGMVSRGFVRPHLCMIMVLIGALPTAVAFLFLAVASGGLKGLELAVVGTLFVVYAFSSLETVWHLYSAMLTQLLTKRELSNFARIDHLTGLPNRLALHEAITLEAEGNGRPLLLALLLIDLDGFKAVNDRFGHPVGDKLLREVGQRLNQTVRSGDLAARIGGDEFAVIQAALPGPQEAEALGQRIIRALAIPFDIDGAILEIGSSIGIALDDGSVGDIDELVARADGALYRAKRSGGNAQRVWKANLKLTLVA